MKKQKVVVIGIDGATFELIVPWIQNGKLPFLKRLKDEGVWGKLESTIPPVTFPAWKCYSTGKNPGKLGVYYWFSVDFYKKGYRFNNSLDFKSQEIWDYLGQNNYRVSIINMPSTYPPKKVNGFLISGMQASEDSLYTFPPE